MIALPIDPVLPEITAALERENRLALQASPGSGKTTRVPVSLLKSAFAGPAGKIIVLEPRRLAAKWAALRVAEELGERPGETVGYRFRFENVGGARSRLIFVTEGMFSRMLLENRDLSGVSAVVLDEFHERHLHSDIALGYLKRLQESRRPDLRLLVMSATLDTESLCRYLDCRSIVASGRQYPVEIEYLRAAPARPLEWTLKDELNRLLRAQETPPGDFLVFLPGMAEIRRCAEALSSLDRDPIGRRVAALPLHGDLSREEQDRAMRKGVDRRVILSTNIAETSLTIEGVNTVIDSGLHRIASNSWWSGLPALRTRPISRASAAQRAGRAGRTAPGKCLRLYTKGDHDGRAPFETPEVLRLDLAQSALELMSLGLRNLDEFPWFESPSTQSLMAARELLFLLGAVSNGELTEIGKRLVRIPAHPRLGRLLLEGADRGVLNPAAALAALLSEGSLASIDALRAAIDARLTDSERRVRDQLLAAVSGRERAGALKGEEFELARACLAGFPDRVAKKRELSSGSNRAQASQLELVFCGGGSSFLENSAVIAGDEYFVVLEAQENQAAQQLRSRTTIRSLCPIQSDWLIDLQPGLLREEDLYEWDQQRERVMRVSRVIYGQLVLFAETKPAEPGPGIPPVLLREGLKLDLSRMPGMGLNDWITALERVVPREVSESCLSRISVIAANAQEIAAMGLVDPASGKSLEKCFSPLLSGTSSLHDLRSLDWRLELPVAFGFPAELLHRMDELAPEFVTLPSGRRTRIHYELGHAPWIESRLQDFFGWEEGPSLFRKKVPIVLRLLAPSQRPVQVTTDLRSFWERTYPELRGQLSRRYPKHAWPENPRVAIPLTGKGSGK